MRDALPIENDPHRDDVGRHTGRPAEITTDDILHPVLVGFGLNYFMLSEVGLEVSFQPTPVGQRIAQRGEEDRLKSTDGVNI